MTLAPRAKESDAGPAAARALTAATVALAADVVAAMAAGLASSSAVRMVSNASIARLPARTRTDSWQAGASHAKRRLRVRPRA